MPALKKTDHVGEIVWLGHSTAEGGTLRATAADQLDLLFGGLKGARHEGLLRKSCARVRDLYPVGTSIQNTRQISILSEEELAKTAADMGMDHLDPALVGANIVVRGIGDFSHLPPSSRLQGPNGVTLTVDMQNRPCIFPGKEIDADHPGKGASYKPAAKGRRGVTAWVECPGALRLGDLVQLFVPDQRAWAP